MSGCMRQMIAWLFAVAATVTPMFFSHSALAQTIMYPGTFDPFHTTHLEELKGAIKLKNAKAVVVFPIQRAYYAEEGGEPFPKLLEYQLRAKLIGDALAGEGIAGEARSDLSFIRSNVFETILLAYSQINDRDKFLLIGTDVLATWSQLPRFEDFVSKVRIVVSTDPADPQLTTDLQKKLGTNPRIEFADFKLEGVRAADIKQQLFSDFETARRSLPKSTGEFFAEHPEVLINSGTKLNTKLKVFFSNQLVSTLARDLGIRKFTLQDFRRLAENFDVVEKFYQSPDAFDPVSEQMAELLLPNQESHLVAEKLRAMRRRADIDRNASRAIRSMAIMSAISQRAAKSGWNPAPECGKLEAELVESAVNTSLPTSPSLSVQ